MFPLKPPIEPMLAKASDGLPDGDGWIYEPKWDGFRAIVFKDGDKVEIQSRDLKPLHRYFPELLPALRKELPARCVVDGEIVIATPGGLDFEALQLRLHPAATRINKLAVETPASFVAFDLLALDEDVSSLPQAERRQLLEQHLGRATPPIHLTPATGDRALAAEWFTRFEGAGLDGVMAKRSDGGYVPGKRVMIKVKHARTADCVVAGLRWHKNGPGTLIGSLLLGLYDQAGRLGHVGVTSAFTMARRKELVDELKPLTENALENHPWASWGGEHHDETGQRMPGGQSRWSKGKDLSWTPVRAEWVAEVKYEHLQGLRFRHAAVFRCWRRDKAPADCRYDQLEVTPAYELRKIFKLSDAEPSPSAE